MSDLVGLLTPPYEPGTKEYDEYQRGLARGPLTALSLAPGALFNVLPLGKTDEGDVVPRPPGIVSGTYGFLGDAVPKAISKFTGTNLPSAPGAETATKWAGETAREARDLIPTHKLAENPTEELAHDLFFSAGTAISPFPAKALTALPRFLQGPASFVLPTLEHSPRNAVIAGTIAGADIAQQQAAAASQPQDTALAPVQAEPSKPITPADAAQVAKDAKPAATPFSIQDILAEPSNQPFSIDAAIRGDTEGKAPTFNKQGESGITVGDVVAGAAGLALLLGAAKYTHSIGVRVTAAARDARMNDPALVQKTMDFQNARMANQGAQISENLGETTQAPLPTGGVVNRAATAAKTNVLDENASLQNYIRLTSEDPRAADLLAHQFCRINNDMSHEATMREFLNTGVDHATGVSMPSPARVFQDIDALSETRQKLLADGMHAADELNNRAIMRGKGMQGGYNFYNVNDAMLQNHVAAMQADPVLADIANRSWMIEQKLMDMGGARGFFTPSEVADMQRLHPNHVAQTDMEGRILHAIGPRAVTPNGGVEQATTTPWAAQAQHIEALFRQYELNNVRADIVSHQLNVQRQFPNSARVLEPVPPPANVQTYWPTVQRMGSNVREHIVAIRDGTGAKWYRVNNPQFYDWITGNSHARMKAEFDGASVFRRMVQSGTTGVASVATGRAFPVINAVRTAIQMPINRPAGHSGGLLDWATRGVYRGFDPTNLVGAAYSLARGGADDLALQLSHMLHPSNQSKTTQLLVSALGQPKMQQISNALKNYYLGTTTHEMRSLGIGGQGVPFRGRLPAFLKTGGASPETVRLVSGELAPRLFIPGGRLGTIKPHMINLRRAAESIFQSIGDASHEYHYRLNRTLNKIDPTSLAYETRQLVGDPGTHGAGKTVGLVRNVVPYANVSGQGVGRYGRAFNESPIGTTYATASTLGSLALLSLYSAMQNDATRDYLQDIITQQGRAANVVLFTGPNPQMNSQWSLPQELRAPYTMMLDIVSKALHLAEMKHDDNVHDGVLSFFKNWFSEHIENSTWLSALHGTADAMNIVDMPSYLNALMAPTGNAIRLDIDKIVNDYRNGQLSWKSVVMPTGSDGPLPNHPPGDSLLEGENAKVFTTIMSNLLGVFGAGLANTTHSYLSARNQGATFWDSLGQAGKDWLQNAKDLNPGLNTILWENPVRESVRPPLVEGVQRTLNIMKQTQGATTAERYEGTTGGTRPLQVPAQQGPGKVPTDPTMRSMYFAVAQEYNFINSHVMNDINQLRKQMAAQQDQIGDPQAKREWMNAQTRKITDKYRYVQQRINDLNAALSRVAGKSVNVNGIDWSKGVEQFN